MKADYTTKWTVRNALRLLWATLQGREVKIILPECTFHVKSGTVHGDAWVGSAGDELDEALEKRHLPADTTRTDQQRDIVALELSARDAGKEE